MSTNLDRLKQIIEGALLAAGRPLSIDHILSLFLDEEQPTRDEIREALEGLQTDCESRGVELKEVASGFRFQVKADYGPWVSRLWEEKPARYSRATLETLALIAYRQPITRSEIEDVRGVSVSSNIVKSLLEREWVRVVGHRDVPGKPALYGTTKGFLDYFNLKSLSELPPLAELRNIESIEHELDFGQKETEETAGEGEEDNATQLEIGHEDEKAIIAAATQVASDDIQTEAIPAEERTADVDQAMTEEAASHDETPAEEQETLVAESAETSEASIEQVVADQADPDSEHVETVDASGEQTETDQQPAEAAQETEEEISAESAQTESSDVPTATDEIVSDVVIDENDVSQKETEALAD